MVDRIANSSQNGYNFQTVAAISLILDYLNELSKIKNEHQLEDIAIQLTNESWIFAQSKSSLDPDHSNKAHDYFKKGVQTLSDAHESEPQSKIIYITNIKKMLGSNTETDDFVSGETIWYADLDEQNQKIIEKIVPKYFDYRSFGIQYLKYKGDETDWRGKEKWIRGKIREHFQQLPYLGKLNADDIFNSWKMYLNYNAGESNPEKYCSKEDLVWAMILPRITYIDNDIYQESEQDYSEVINVYSDAIYSLSGRFETISRISGDFYRFRIDNPNVSIAEYANTEWEQYVDIVESFDCSDRIKKQVVKILVETILRRRDVIHGVQKEMGI